MVPDSVTFASVVKRGKFPTVLVALGLSFITVQPSAGASTGNDAFKISRRNEAFPTRESYQALISDGGDGSAMEGSFQVLTDDEDPNVGSDAAVGDPQVVWGKPERGLTSATPI